MKNIVINGENLTIEDVVSVARHGSLVELSKDAIEKIKKSRKVVEEMAEKITEILRLPFYEWQKLSRLAYESTKKFSWEESAREHFRLFKTLLKKSSKIQIG